MKKYILLWSIIWLTTCCNKVVISVSGDDDRKEVRERERECVCACASSPANNSDGIVIVSDTTSAAASHNHVFEPLGSKVVNKCRFESPRKHQMNSCES